MSVVRDAIVSLYELSPAQKSHMWPIETLHTRDYYVMVTLLLYEPTVLTHASYMDFYMIFPHVWTSLSSCTVVSSPSITCGLSLLEK
jgi:hypothetical protein